MLFKSFRPYPFIRQCSKCITNLQKNRQLVLPPGHRKIHSMTSSRSVLKPVQLCSVQQPIFWTGIRTIQFGTDVNLKQTAKMITAKRPTRRKPASGLGDQEMLKVTAYAVGEEIYLDELRKALEIQGLYNQLELPADVDNAIYVKANYAVNGNSREIFFFKEGSVVFWNLPTTERNEVIRFVQKHCQDPYDISLSLHENERMEFQLSEGITDLSGDKINLCTVNKTDEELNLEKYTCSNALTQSVKLAIWEASLETFISSIEQVTEDLRDGKKIKMSRRDVLRKTGELFALRHEINLSSDLLDTPDFYWDRDILETLYQRVCNHLIIARRTKVLNERIKHCCELTELLSSHLNDTHHVRLEWMIIVLIMVEVVFETVHYMDRYFTRLDDTAQENIESTSDIK
ncbi:hypothetical protein SNE40_003531 [Patella caerulea]|uniref:DUF155 domain-containing protein n=3 Tax=Patella caerulea TaxID=87958 RepID=A0AAN8KBG5_PATCE